MTETPGPDYAPELETADKAIAELTEDENEPLPPEIMDVIKRGLAEGVRFSISHEPGEHGLHTITGIHWRPGDPNALAEAIILKVHAPMPLELDGHKYVIVPDDADR